MTNRTIRSLLDRFSHEVRNSVHASLGSLSADADLQISLRNSKSGVDRLLRYVDDLRELLSNDSEASSGAEPFLNEPAEEFDVTLSLGEAIEVLNLESGDRANRLVFQSPGRSLVGRQQRGAVEETLRRILDAVLKLGPKGEARVTLAEAANGGGVRFTIMPDGGQIASRIAAWLNANPERVNIDTTDDVLCGLSTLVAGKRLRALGGSAESISDAGAAKTLAIYLPWRLDTAEDRAAEPSLRDPPGLNVLLAEDCDDSFRLTGILLENETVCRARDGLEALLLMQARRFDVVLMDVHMPRLDGYQAIHSMREWEIHTGNARTPIVVLSSDDLDTQMRAAQAGCCGFLRKPVDSYELGELLDRFRAMRSLQA